ncbi:hypothetical protein SAMN05421778_101339 [Sphaerotilus natans]|nr:hypothetical protein SAMN05421778_101339 [Sphaerotilus natans]
MLGITTRLVQIRIRAGRIAVRHENRGCKVLKEALLMSIRKDIPEFADDDRLVSIRSIASTSGYSVTKIIAAMNAAGIKQTSSAPDMLRSGGGGWKRMIRKRDAVRLISAMQAD